MTLPTVGARQVWSILTKNDPDQDLKLIRIDHNDHNMAIPWSFLRSYDLKRPTGLRSYLIDHNDHNMVIPWSFL